MRETTLVLTEIRPEGRDAPDKEALRRIVAAWLKRELEKK